MKTFNRIDLIHQQHPELKVPPYSEEAEQSVLGAMMMSDEAYWTASGIVKREDFFRTEHRTLYDAIVALAEQDKPRDIVTVFEWLEKTEKLEKAGGLHYVGRMVVDTPSAAKHNVEVYSKIVAKDSRARRAITIASEGAAELYNTLDPDAAISQIQQKLESLAMGLSQETSFRDLLNGTIDMIERNRERRLDGKLAGVPYGLPALDERTGGMRPGQLIAIAGRPSLGKTAFAHQVALQAAGAGYPIGEISLEMSNEQLGIRSFANRFRVNGTALMFGYDPQIQQLTEALAMAPAFKDIPLYVDSETYDYHAIVSRIVEWRRKHKIEAVFIDHIGLIRLDQFTNKVDRLGYITNNFKRLAKKLDMPINIICQLNRAADKEKRRPVLSDFRDCGEIEQDVDVGIFLHSDADDDERQIEIEMGLLKNRDGVRGWLPDDARFHFRKAIQVFEQAAKNEP